MLNYFWKNKAWVRTIWKKKISLLDPLNSGAVLLMQLHAQLDNPFSALRRCYWHSIIVRRLQILKLFCCENSFISRVQDVIRETVKKKTKKLESQAVQWFGFRSFSGTINGVASCVKLRTLKSWLFRYGKYGKKSPRKVTFLSLDFP